MGSGGCVVVANWKTRPRTSNDARTNTKRKPVRTTEFFVCLELTKGLPAMTRVVAGALQPAPHAYNDTSLGIEHVRPVNPVFRDWPERRTWREKPVDALQAARFNSWEWGMGRLRSD